MGYKLSWEIVDGLAYGRPALVSIPIVLACPQETCIERIRQRHLSNPTTYAPPELFPHLSEVSTFLDERRRPEVRVVDASRQLDEVYESVRGHVVAQLGEAGMNLPPRQAGAPRG